MRTNFLGNKMVTTKTKKKTDTAKKLAETMKKEKEEREWAAQQKRDEFERKIKKWIKLLIGLLVCTGGIWLIAIFWQDFLRIFKAWVGPGVIMIGLFIMLLGALE